MFLYFVGLSIGLQIGKYVERDKNYNNYVEMREKVQLLENKLIKMNHDCTIKQTTNTNETYYKDDT